MSLWPRLRRRSSRGGRKRAGAKPNPYSNIGLDKLALVHAEFEAQKALFAAEKGVPVSVVRFVSGSPRGWTLLPRSSVSPSPDEEDYEDRSTTSTASSSPARASVQTSNSPPPRTSVFSTESVSEAEATSSSSSWVQPPISEYNSSSPPPEPPAAASNAGSSGNNNLTEEEDESSNTRGQLVVFLEKDQQGWNNKVLTTGSVLLVNFRVVSRALGFNILLALFVSSWSRGQASFKRAFSLLGSHLLSAIRPALRLKPSSKPLSSSSQEEEEEGAEMKVTPASPISPVVSSKEIDADSRLSSFEFPVLSRDPSSASTPVFRVQKKDSQQQQLRPVVTSVKVVAVSSSSSSQPGSPAPSFDGSKGSQKPCQKLKARIFKSHPPRKVTPATSENSSAEEDSTVMDGGAEVEAEPEAAAAQIKAPPQGPESPRATDSSSSSRCKRLSFIKRRPRSSRKATDSDDQQSTTESEIEDVSSPSAKVLTSRNPNSSTDGAAGGKKKVSRSQELKLSFKNLKKRYKSQDLCPIAANDQEFEQLALEAAAVKSLEEMDSPFSNSHETDSSTCSTPTTPGPNKAEKKRSCLAKMLSGDFEKSGEGSCSPRSTTITTSRVSKSLASPPVSRMPNDKNSVIDCRPELRKVRTNAARGPLPADRSSVLDRETLGAILVLAILAFLLLGKIPAILGTACLCLVLSHVQKFLSQNMTPLGRERIAAAAAASRSGAGLSRLGGTSPPHSQGSPAVDVQSSEYRKKVLLEGFLDRGNRR